MEQEKMGRKKILPINKKPFIHSYAHHAFSNAIIDHPGLYCSEDLQYRTSVTGFHIYKRGQYNRDCQPVIHMYDDIKTVSMNSSMQNNQKLYYDYYHIEGDGSLRVDILQMKQFNVMSEAGILVSFYRPDEQHSDFVKGMYIAEKRICSLYSHVNQPKKENIRHMKQLLPVSLRATRKDQHLYFEVLKDGFEWQVFYQIDHCSSTDFYIGIYYEPKSFTYFNWLYSNYIQLHCDPTMGELSLMQDVELDFFTGFKTRGNYYLNNPFLFTETIERCDILDMVSARDFFVQSIHNNYYIEAKFNERYIPHRSAYQDYDHNHVNLIYGYDLDREVYYVMGYDENLMLSFFPVPFTELERATYTGVPKEINEDYVHRICLASPEKDYKLNTELMISFLEDYLSGVNSFERCAFITVPLNRVFGIKVYDCIIDCFDFIQRNHRVFYSLHEHKMVMLSRLDFLLENGILQSGQYDRIYQIYKDITWKTEKILYMVLKHHINRDLSFSRGQKETLANMLREIQRTELEILPELIDILLLQVKQNKGHHDVVQVPGESS